MVVLTLQESSVQESSVRAASLEKLLLRYVMAACPGHIPGCDGMTTQQILRGYPHLAEQGIVPACQQLDRLHPEFGPQFKHFFHQTLDPFHL